MVKISLDEAYAYDLLAICEVKIKKNINNAKINYELIFNELQDQINNLHLTILSSDEYNNLLDVNEKTFDAVEKARYGTITAKEVDNLNMQRFLYKQKLQLKFFPKSNILEQKS
jgi:hypothetical protein